MHSGSELVIELRVHGGDVELVLAPGMVVDANQLGQMRQAGSAPGGWRRAADQLDSWPTQPCRKLPAGPIP